MCLLVKEMKQQKKRTYEALSRDKVERKVLLLYRSLVKLAKVQ